ncbi:hypothetical protein Rvan_1865 [Rhodomicrobium vannielii ATCC 17100]|uniref:Uncharacterized protein n=1 Tax=Rhodomicrobium vannielii (strain ATCC 17100 / DSM 162 / LMG 4299 / NCIMB 10020 / ATH 3.1.1) TaxID=648757 RepID=E3I071_RHOVT|nr:hypothetical protein [Rhodomicrobium vannielii]ADP71106.1 hypothetical protein Rvan_1865 [Rhodomicrobium vannielii ATCC 17100]
MRVKKHPADAAAAVVLIKYDAFRRLSGEHESSLLDHLLRQDRPNANSVFEPPRLDDGFAAH